MSRRTTLRRAAVPALALASALLLAGCSGGGDGKKTEPDEGPLSKYMSAMYDDEDFTQEKFDKEQKKIEELVAECMTKEGFEYKPNVQSSGGAVVGSGGEEEDGPEWGSVEFAEKYGYGMIDWPGMEEMTNSEEEMEEYVDPNQKYIESLSPSEQEAFYETLSGPQPTEEEMAAMEDGEGMEYDWKTGGCYGAAQHKVQGEGGMAAYEDPEFAELFAQMEELWSGLYGDGVNPSENDEIAKLDRAWSDCMSDAGFDFASPTAAQTSINDEYNELQMPEGEDGEWVELSKADQKKFKKHEIETAVADAKCKEKGKYDDKVLDIQFKLEQKFVDEHKAELDAMLAKHGVKKKQ